MASSKREGKVMDDSTEAQDVITKRVKLSAEGQRYFCDQSDAGRDKARQD